MAENIYLPPKNAEWNNPLTLGDDSDISEYKEPYGDMKIINEEYIDEAIYPPIDETGEYHHKDGHFRHPQTLYLVPGNPRNRSDSLTR